MSLKTLVSSSDSLKTLTNFFNLAGVFKDFGETIVTARLLHKTNREAFLHAGNRDGLSEVELRIPVGKKV